MFISEEQARARLASPENLGRRFNINAMRAARERSIDRVYNKDSYASQSESGISERETEIPEILSTEEESQRIESLPAESGGTTEYNSDRITHQKIGHPGRIGPRLTIETRTEIAIAARTSGLSGRSKETQQEIAERYGISRQGVAEINAGHGAVDKKAFDNAVEQARERALDKLMLSLGLITEEKVANASVRDLSYLAANMARIVEKTIPDSSRGGNINLVIYTPEIRKEASFDTVEIG